MCQGPEPGEFMIATQKGIINGYVNDENMFSVRAQISEYQGLYCVNVNWAGDQKFVIVTRRRRYSHKRDGPPG